MNLTRIEKLEGVVRLHYCESLFLGRPTSTWALFESWILELAQGFLRVSGRDPSPGVCGGFGGVGSTESGFPSGSLHGCSEREGAIGFGRNLWKVAYDWAISRAVRPQEVIEASLAPNVAMLLNEKEALSAIDAFDILLAPHLDESITS